MTENNTQSPKAYYIVTNAQGEQFLLPYYSETFRVLMDDKNTIRDMLNCLLGLDSDHEIVDLDYEFEKPIDIFMPEDDSVRLDVWVTTKDNRYFNIELQNRSHPFFLDRLQLYNSYQTLRGKYEYDRSAYFKLMDEKERKVHFYELPEMISIWLCNFSILKSNNIFKDTWAVYSEDEVCRSDAMHRALPVFSKNKYIIVDLPNFKRLRKNISSREDYWLKLLSQGPLEVPKSKDPIFRDALNRLRVSRISPELLKALEEHMFDKHADEAIEAEIWLKAEAKGRAQGLEQGREEGLEQGLEQGRKQGREQGLEQGLEQGRKQGREQGLEQGRKQGREQERLKNKNDTVTVLREMGLSEEKIAEAQARLETLQQNRLSK